MESIIARTISALAEQYHLLPNTHMEGRRMRSTDQAIQYLVETVLEAWTQRMMASLLLPDAIGAFDMVSHP